MALSGPPGLTRGALPHLLGLGPEALEAWAVAEGQPAFRGRQLHDWIYAKGARTLEAITVLPKAWREQLAKREQDLERGSDRLHGGSGLIGRSSELQRSVARDGTIKLLLATADGLSLETVGIPADDRLTVCVSSQVGCPMACLFCATGKQDCSARWRCTRSLIRC